MLDIFVSVRQTETVQYTCQVIPQRESCVGCVFWRPVVVVGWSELQLDVLVSRQGEGRKGGGCISV
jgi:hypothetical protein